MRQKQRGGAESQKRTDVLSRKLRDVKKKQNEKKKEKERMKKKQTLKMKE